MKLFPSSVMDSTNIKIKPGECVWCRVEAPEPGGYLVTLTASGIQGFVPSHDPIDIGRAIPATFICMNGDRALLSYAFVMGTSSRVQFSKASDQEIAFAVWADSYPHAIQQRRAVDVVMPSLDSSPILMKLDEKSAREVFSSIETTEFTGCVKVFCQTRLSRSAVVFLRGRAVGAIYTTKMVPDSYPFEAALRKMLADVSSKNTEADLEMYELPSDIVLPMSAFFLGYLVPRADDLDNAAYAEKMLEHFSKVKGTACLSLLEESMAVHTLSFIFAGNFKGTYSVGDKAFTEAKDLLVDQSKCPANTKLHAYILPDAMTTSSMHFGYGLSSDHFNSDDSLHR